MSLSSIETQTTPSSSRTGPSAKKTTSAEADFMRFAKMSPIDRMRVGILKSMDLTEERLAALSPAERQKVEDVIKTKIQEALSGTSGESGKAASNAAPSGIETSAATAPMSADTLGGLIAIQAESSGSATRANA